MKSSKEMKEKITFNVAEDVVKKHGGENHNNFKRFAQYRLYMFSNVLSQTSFDCRHLTRLIPRRDRKKNGPLINVEEIVLRFGIAILACEMH